MTVMGTAYGGGWNGPGKPLGAANPGERMYYEPACTATLIKSDIVLAAAHCNAPRNGVIDPQVLWPGAFNLSAVGENKNYENIRDPKEIIAHPCAKDSWKYVETLKRVETC